MTDDLTISGGGSTAVATVDLLDQAERLRELVAGLADCAVRLDAIDRRISANQLQDANAVYRAFTAERRIDDARFAIRAAGVTAESLVAGLVIAAEAYGAVERAVQQLNQAVAAKFAYALGFLFPGLVLLLGPLFASTAAAGAAAYAMMPPERRNALLRWLTEQNEVVTDPRLVMLVRLGIASTDDFAAGIIRLSPHLVHLLGDEGLGLLGLASTAGALVGAAGPLGALAETPVRVDRVSTRHGQTVAAGFRDRADRIPDGDNQIRIDRYHTPGEPDRFEVYLGGTKDPSPMPGTEPWDMTSNVNALSMGDAGSYRAAQDAMRLAGITPESPVIFAGHSQGGLIAAALAGSGEYNAHGLFTVGGVVSQNLVPEGVPWLAIEHTDDLIPALGGTRSAPDAVLVRREVFGGAEVPSDVVLPAHELSRYRETAAMVDATGDGRTGQVLEQFNRTGAGAASVTTTRYLARRMPAAG